MYEKKNVRGTNVRKTQGRECKLTIRTDMIDNRYEQLTELYDPYKIPPQKPVSLEAQDWQQWTYATVAACTFGFQIEQNRLYRAS